jgi:hypothetical protein
MDSSIGRKSLRLNTQRITDKEWLLQRLLGKNAKSKRIKKDKVYHKQQMTPKMKEKIVIMRYGAVGNMTRVHHSLPDISRKLCVQYSTLHKFMIKYKQNQGVIVHTTTRRPKGLTKLSPRII